MENQMKENAYSIYIKNRSFLPELFNIKINDTIVFCNMDKIECCIFSKSFSSFPNVYIPSNDKFIFTFLKSGKYELCIKDNKHNMCKIEVTEHDNNKKKIISGKTTAAIVKDNNIKLTSFSNISIDNNNKKSNSNNKNNNNKNNSNNTNNVKDSKIIDKEKQQHQQQLHTNIYTTTSTTTTTITTTTTATTTTTSKVSQSVSQESTKSLPSTIFLEVDDVDQYLSALRATYSSSTFHSKIKQQQQKRQQQQQQQQQQISGQQQTKGDKHKINYNDSDDDCTDSDGGPIFDDGDEDDDIEYHNISNQRRELKEISTTIHNEHIANTTPLSNIGDNYDIVVNDTNDNNDKNHNSNSKVDNDDIGRSKVGDTKDKDDKTQNNNHNMYVDSNYSSNSKVDHNYNNISLTTKKVNIHNSNHNYDSNNNSSSINMLPKLIIMIKNYRFQYSNINVYINQPIEFLLSSSVKLHVEHELIGTSVIKELNFQSIILTQLNKCISYIFIPKEIGSIDVSCTIYPEMKCVIYVIPSPHEYYGDKSTLQQVSGQQQQQQQQQQQDRNHQDNDIKINKTLSSSSSSSSLIVVESVTGMGMGIIPNNIDLDSLLLLLQINSTSNSNNDNTYIKDNIENHNFDDTESSFADSDDVTDFDNNEFYNNNNVCGEIYETYHDTVNADNIDDDDLVNDDNDDDINNHDIVHIIIVDEYTFNPLTIEISHGEWIRLETKNKLISLNEMHIICNHEFEINHDSILIHNNMNAIYNQHNHDNNNQQQQKQHHHHDYNNENNNNTYNYSHHQKGKCYHFDYLFPTVGKFIISTEIYSFKKCYVIVRFNDNNRILFNTSSSANVSSRSNNRSESSSYSNDNFKTSYPLLHGSFLNNNNNYDNYDKIVKDNQLAEVYDQSQQKIIISNKINDDNSITSSLSPIIQTSLTIMKNSNNLAINDNNDKPSLGTNNNNILNETTKPKPMALYGSFSFQDASTKNNDINNKDISILNSVNKSNINDDDAVDCVDHDRDDDAVYCDENDEDYSSDLQLNKIQYDIGSRVDILLQNNQKILAHTDDLEEFLSDDDNDHYDHYNDENGLIDINANNSNNVTILEHDDVKGCDYSYGKGDNNNNDNNFVDKLNTSQSIINEKLMTKVENPSIIDDQSNSQPSIIVEQHVTIETSPYVAEHQTIAIGQSSSITNKSTKTQIQSVVAQQQQATLHSIPSLKKSMKFSSTTPSDKVKQPTTLDPQLSSSASKSKRLLAFLHTTPVSISSNTKMSLLSDSTNINISRDEKNSFNVSEVLQPQNNYDNNNYDDKSCNTDGIYNSSNTVNIDENKDSDDIGYYFNHTRNEMRNEGGGDVIIKIEDSSRIVHQPYTYNEIEIFMLNRYDEMIRKYEQKLPDILPSGRSVPIIFISHNQNNNLQDKYVTINNMQEINHKSINENLPSSTAHKTGVTRSSSTTLTTTTLTTTTTGSAGEKKKSYKKKKSKGK